MHGYQHPQPDVRDGEELVVADAVTARLLSVAGEAGLLIPPDALGGNHQHQDSEDEDDREPDASDAGGMPVYAADHGIKGPPVHLRLQMVGISGKAPHFKKQERKYRINI
uniref:Uncharacterized protein n=1 Tax=Cyprinodon variegatus TaxID=28743 RepID=A0A3Q2DME1_CYPVA